MFRFLEVVANYWSDDLFMWDYDNFYHNLSTKRYLNEYSAIQDKFFLNLHMMLIWNFSNPGHNILELYNVLTQVPLATSKIKIDINLIKNLVFKLPHELPNGLRLRILGN